MLNFGWFSSGRDQAAIDLLEAVCRQMDRGFIPGRLAFVFCDRAPGESRDPGPTHPPGPGPHLPGGGVFAVSDWGEGQGPTAPALPPNPPPNPISIAWEGGACGPDFPG